MASQLNGFFVMLIGLGGLLVLLGAFVFLRTRRPEGRTQRSSGVVIDQEEEEDDGSTVYSPIVKFTAHDGTETTFTDAFASYPALYKVGEQVDVMYDPRNVRNARIASGLRRHLPAIILVVLGAALLIVGLWLRA
ncbi:MAG TPA: DUF3592 domain-containing protein [Candidatus Kapabacteria bacterium]|nr:DUF3592 domain-containing protein [Candidatus Kapabacteria bacterium]